MRVMKFLFKFAVYFILITVAWVGIYAFVPPPITATMIMDENGVTKDWTSFSDISPNMARAVIAAEDSKFCSHNGFDTEAIQKAIERNAQGGRIRGGSTISQQVAKKLGISPVSVRNGLRKLQSSSERWLVTMSRRF